MQRKNKLGKALAVVFALLLWQIAAAAVDQSILLVSPVDVAVRMTSIWQVDGFASSIWFSFYHIAGGFLLALAVGVLLAALSGRFPWIETALWPFMITVKTVPVASFRHLPYMAFGAEPVGFHILSYRASGRLR